MPMSPCVIATVYINRCVIRLRYRQIQRMELRDKAFGIVDRIREEAGDVIVFACLNPGVRRLSTTKSLRYALLGDDAYLIDDLATCIRIDLVL